MLGKEILGWGVGEEERPAESEQKMERNCIARLLLHHSIVIKELTSRQRLPSGSIATMSELDASSGWVLGQLKGA